MLLCCVRVVARVRVRALVVDRGIVLVHVVAIGRLCVCVVDVRDLVPVPVLAIVIVFVLMCGRVPALV